MPAASITPLDLLILGLLQDRPMHGYELHQQVKGDQVDAWFSMSMAGIYYSLAKLRDRGMIAESRQHRSGSADKAIYFLTEAGRVAFFQALEQQVAGETETFFDYDLGIFLLNRLPVERAVALLEGRRVFLAGWAQRVRERQSRAGWSPLSAQARAILDHTARFIEMERAWLGEVIQSVSTAAAPAQGEAAPGLMILAGDLRQQHLPDLIRLIAAGGHTGTLTLTDGELTRSITFVAGQPACFGAFGRNQAPAAPDAAAIREAICALFDWPEGRFSFDQAMARPDLCVEAGMSVEQLILCGCRCVDRWEIIRRLVPTADTVYELDVPAEKLADLELSPDERRVAGAIDGAHSVADVAQQAGLTIFDASRSLYCLAAIGAIRVADSERIRVRRLFREIAELMCRSTIVWRSAPDDRTCEHEVNARCEALPLRINEGRISDQSDPKLRTGELVALYAEFLRSQLDVISRRFGRENARQAYRRAIQQLVPELQDVGRHWAFDRLGEE